MAQGRRNKQRFQHCIVPGQYQICSTEKDWSSVDVIERFHCLQFTNQFNRAFCEGGVCDGPDGRHQRSRGRDGAGWPPWALEAIQGSSTSKYVLIWFRTGGQRRVVLVQEESQGTPQSVQGATQYGASDVDPVSSGTLRTEYGVGPISTQEPISVSTTSQRPVELSQWRWNCQRHWSFYTKSNEHFW